MREYLRKKLEDLLILKATQKLRRAVNYREIKRFFIHKQYDIERLEKDFEKRMNEIIIEYLEEIR